MDRDGLLGGITRGLDPVAPAVVLGRMPVVPLPVASLQGWLAMICKACRAQLHELCEQCDCQHRTADVLLGVAEPAMFAAVRCSVVIGPATDDELRCWRTALPGTVYCDMHSQS